MKSNRDAASERDLRLFLALPATVESRVQKIIELVSCGAAYSIRDLAHQLRLSPSTLQRLFKQHTGVRLGEWLMEQRLQRAAHLLQFSYLSVKQITHTVGYEHVSSFTRAFERRFVHAPSLYRKQGWERAAQSEAQRVTAVPSAVGRG
jgi:AraC family transcriptional regulator, mar-sox-rob regulon activator